MDALHQINSSYGFLIAFGILAIWWAIERFAKKK